MNAIRLFLASLAACGLATAQTIIIPASVDATTEGSSSSAYPWGRAAGYVRVQYCYDTSNFTNLGISYPILIQGARWRANATSASWTGGTYSNVTIAVGESAFQYNAQTNTFDANYIGGVTPPPAYSGAVTVLPGTGNGTGVPAPWYVQQTFASPFLYDPTQGNDLIMDFTVDGTGGNWSGGTTSNDLDGAASLTTRTWTTTAGSPTATTVNQAIGLVAELTYVPASGLYANFTADRATAGPGELVQFTDTTFTDDPAGVTSWAWDFDGNASIDSTVQNPSWAFAGCGPQNVTLTVTDSSRSNSITKTGIVDVRAPAASFTATPSVGLPPLVVQFTDTSTNLPTAWAWDFDGDGAVDSTQQNPVWGYATQALFTVRLTATNACGSSSVTGTIDTRPNPVIVNSFTYAGTFASGVGLDPITDEVWVIDQTAKRVYITQRDGTPVTDFAVPPPPNATSALAVGGFVDPLTGNAWICDESEDVYEIDRHGVVLNGWSSRPSITDASAMTFDPDTRTVFVSNDSGNVVQEFDLTGMPIGPALNVGALGSADADGLVYNPLTHTLLLGEDTGDRILEIDRAGTVLLQTYDTSAVLDASTGNPVAVSPEGLAIDTRTGSLFVGDGFGGKVHEILNIIPAPVGTVTRYGSGCADSGGTVPVAGISRLVQENNVFELAVQTSVAPASTAQAFFLLGLTRLQIDLGFLGAAGCDLLTLPDIAAIGPLPRNANDRAGLRLRLGTGLAGATLDWQAILLPDTNPTGLAVSNGIESRVQ